MLLSFALSLSSFPSLAHVGMILLLVLGFGFIIFWHELGHFLAAKWVDIRVEQFAVGFGHAVVSWRKGIGFRLGSTQKEYRERAETLLRRQRGQSNADAEYTDTELFAAADEIGLGETEYRLNYIPLGGYVKMAGQDDLKPDAPVDDPRAYTKKSIGARMLVISAGVILNMILAAIGFMVLFMMGFHVSPAWAGNVVPGSPAQIAGLRVGDHILSFDGKPQQDFTKIMLNTALVKEGVPVHMIIDRPDDRDNPNTTYHRMDLIVTPSRANVDQKFLAIGFSPPAKLQGIRKEDALDEIDMPKMLMKAPADALLVGPDDTIIAVNGEPIGVDDYAKFYDLMQNSHGRPVRLTIRRADGRIDGDQIFQPHFEDAFSGEFNFAGMMPRVAVASLTDGSPAIGKIKPMDVIESMRESLKDSTVDGWPHPSHELLIKRIGEAGKNGRSFDFNVIRHGEEKPVLIQDLKATLKVSDDRYGLGIGLIPDEEHTVLSEVLPGSAAEKAGMKGGDTLTSINGKPVTTWYEVQQVIADAPQDKDGNPLSLSITFIRSDATPTTAELKLDKADLTNIQEMRYENFLQLREYTKARIASGPVQAAYWGVTETRDFVLQFYLTLRRMVDRSISPSNMMGPVGIFIGGKAFAYRGFDWLLWFLSMISANLAVVNFLPIPVVDGGQFMFLIFEKIKGKPLSARAMTIAQYVGLAFLAAVVLFVTYHDIFRHYG